MRSKIKVLCVAVAALLLVVDTSEARCRKRSRGCGSCCYTSCSTCGTGYSSYYPPNYPPPRGEPIPQPKRTTNYGQGEEQEDGSRATITIRTPANAQVWVNNQQVAGNGKEHRFTSPPLQQNQPVQYQVRARWNQNGQQMDQTRTVTVRPGSQVTVDFSKNQPQEE